MSTPNTREKALRVLHDLETARLSVQSVVEELSATEAAETPLCIAYTTPRELREIAAAMEEAICASGQNPAALDRLDRRFSRRLRAHGRPLPVVVRIDTNAVYAHRIGALSDDWR